MSNSSKALAALLLLALSAGAYAKVEEDTVAVVNGTPILLSEYQKELSTSIDYWNHTEPDALRDPANMKKLRETTLEELINRELLYQEGVRQKIKVRERDVENGVAEIKQRFSKDETGKDLDEAQTEAAFQKQLRADGITYEQFRDRLSHQIMARKLIEEQVKAKVRPPEDKDIKAYFDKIVAYNASGSTEAPKGMEPDAAMAFLQLAAQVKAMSSERVRVARILIKLSPNANENEKKRALKTAQDIVARLKADPTKFAEIAKNESEDPESAARGGELGYVVRGVAPPDFDKAVFSLPVGEISEPILTDVGYNIVRVSEKRAAETPDFDKLKDDLAKFMMNVTFEKDLQAYVKDLKSKAVIERTLSAQAGVPAASGQ